MDWRGALFELARIKKPACAGFFCITNAYGLTGGDAFLFALSTAVAAALLAFSTGLSAVGFIESIFIESVFIESAGIDDVVVVVDGVVVDMGAGAVVVDGVVMGAGAGAGIGAGVGVTGGTGSFLPQAASATTIIEASKSDLFILYKPFMVVW
ncbi:MAG: hypothetical protein M3Q28_00940 [Pseudomonadota bacterium]|nr:hypothetical protein [Pseudomonadota bacterium]